MDIEWLGDAMIIRELLLEKTSTCGLRSQKLFKLASKTFISLVGL